MPQIEENPIMPETPENMPENGFPVDLSREEYIASTLLMAKSGGFLRRRKGWLIFFGVILGIHLAAQIMDFIRNGTPTPDLVATALFLVLIGLFALVVLPACLRHNAGRTYDQSVLGGHKYYGMVYVYSDRLEKVSGGMTNTVRFADSTTFLETEDMMVLLVPDSYNPSIVLPARCLTPEDADMVRRAVFAGIPPKRQRLLHRLTPLARQRMAPPAAEDEETDRKLYTMTVQYERRELIKMAGDAVLRSSIRMLPLYSVAAIGIGLLFGFMSGIPRDPVTFVARILDFFVLMMLVFFMFNISGVRNLERRARRRTPEGGLYIWLTLTERGLIVSGNRTGDEKRIPWVSLKHAVERPNCVEIYNNRFFIRIPKRCIPDMDELRRIVDDHMPRRDR